MKIGLPVLPFVFGQVPLERRHRGEDLLPPSADQNQAHGDRHHQARDDGHRAECLP